MPTSILDFEPQAAALTEAVHSFCAWGWCPATSSNFSFRADEGFFISPSGIDKRHLHISDLLFVDSEGVCTGKPSAEMPLHSMLYRSDSAIGAVLHTHSVHAMVLSLHEAHAGRLAWHGLEIAKAIRGVSSHEDVVQLPIFPNSQDIDALAKRVKLALPSHGFGFLLEGHGLYAWGADVAEARRHLEAYETLLACRMALRSLHANH